jgi:hypothetical protein
VFFLRPESPEKWVILALAHALTTTFAITVPPKRNGIDCSMPVTEIASGDATLGDAVRSGTLNNPIFRTYACT